METSNEGWLRYENPRDPIAGVFILVAWLFPRSRRSGWYCRRAGRCAHHGRDNWIRRTVSSAHHLISAVETAVTLTDHIVEIGLELTELHADEENDDEDKDAEDKA